MCRGHARQLRCRREVLLCAGALQSPQLLMLSGIGPGEHLQQLGIDVVHHLPGVGEHLHDHPDVVQVVDGPQITDSFGMSLAGLRNVWQGMGRWRHERRGMLTSNFAEAGGFIRSGPQERCPICSCILWWASWSTMAARRCWVTAIPAMSVCCSQGAGAA
jgi:choline dehydrogenase-like flavoprotein